MSPDEASTKNRDALNEMGRHKGESLQPAAQNRQSAINKDSFVLPLERWL
jgi:hypothetical protein